MIIGAVPYLNALPLIHGLTVAVQTATPRDLLAQLLEKKLSLALLSTVCLFQHPGLYLLPGMGIGSRGRVESVRLFFNRPGLLPSQLRTISLSPESNTANMLVQLYLRQSGYRKDILLSDHTPKDTDAELVIGDAALTRPDPHGSVDLGQWWWEWTELPFVFAAWISRTPTITIAMLRELQRCKTENLTDVSCCLDSARVRFNIPRERQERYLRHCVHYDLGETELQGLRRFREECIRAELIPNAFPIRFITTS